VVEDMDLEGLFWETRVVPMREILCGLPIPRKTVMLDPTVVEMVGLLVESVPRRRIESAEEGLSATLH
jgi:hypothetical protein